MFKRRYEKLEAKIDELQRLVRLQGEAHSAIMNQVAETQNLVRTESQKLHDRLSFERRPRP